jgi:hypothetical protein
MKIQIIGDGWLDYFVKKKQQNKYFRKSFPDPHNRILQIKLWIRGKWEKFCSYTYTHTQTG